MKNFEVQKFFNPEKPSQAETMKKAPSDGPKLSQEQKMARQSAIIKLDFYIKDKDAFFRGEKAENGILGGLSKMTTSDATIKEIQDNMQKIRDLLTKEYNKDDWDEIISTSLNVIESDGSANLEINATRMTKRVFLQRIVGPTLAAKILSESPQQISREKQHLLQEKIRLERFLKTLETVKANDMDDMVWGNKGSVRFESAIRHTQTLLTENKVEEAIKYFSKVMHGRYRGVNVYHIIGNDESLADAIRKIGDTSGSVHIEKTTQEAKKMKNNPSESKESDDTKKLYEKINTALATENPAKKQEAEKKYNEIIAKLHPNSPTYQELTANPEATKAMMEANLILESVIGDFIKNNKNGSENLPQILRDYDDMKGLHGITNWSDENVKLAREIIIMTAGMVATFGMGTIAGAVAGSARLANAAKFTRAAQYFQKWKYLRWTASWLKAAVPAAVKGAATWVLHTSNLVDKAGVLGMALKFTTTDQLFRSVLWRQEGEKTANFKDFMTNLSKNTVMFAAFAGMEKFLNTTIIARFAPKNVPPTTKIQIGKLAVLSVGDITVMQALHAAETGELEWDWKSAFSALALRGAVSAFPKLQKKFENYRQRKVASPNTKAPDNVAWNHTNNSVKNTSSQSVPAQTKDSQNISAKNTTTKARTKDTALQNQIDNLTGVNQKTGIKKSDLLTADEAEMLKHKLSSNGNIRLDILENKRIAGQILEIGKKKYIYNVGTDKWHVLKPGETILTASFPKTGALTTDAMRAKIIKTYPAHTPPKKVPENNAQKAESKAMSENVNLKNSRENILKEPDFIVEKNYHGNNLKDFMWRTDLLPWTRIEVTIKRPEGWKYTATHEVEAIVNWRIAWKNTGGWNPFNPKTDGKNYFINDNKTQRIESIVVKTPNTSKAERLQAVNNLIVQSEKNRQLISNKTESQKSYSWNLNEANSIDPIKLKNIPTDPKMLPAIFETNPLVARYLENAVNDAKTGNTKKLKNFFHEHWQVIVAGWFLMAVRRYFDSQKTNPFAILPTELSHDPDIAYEQCALCFADKWKSEINYERKTGKVVLDAERRVDISRRWTRDKSWSQQLSRWDRMIAGISQFYPEDAKILDEKMKRVTEFRGNNDEIVAVVQDLQRCLNMDAEDTPLAQDGILGINTTKALKKFIDAKELQIAQETEKREQIEKEQKEKEAENQTNQGEENPWYYDGNPDALNIPLDDSDDVASDVAAASDVAWPVWNLSPVDLNNPTPVPDTSSVDVYD